MKNASDSQVDMQGQTQSDGSPEIWDGIWKDIESGERSIYSPTKPVTRKQFNHKNYFEDLWALMGDKAKDSHYCEIGAGRGTTSTYLRASGAQVTMVDMSDTGFEIAKKNFDKLGIEPADMVIADVRETGIPSDTFDAVLSIGLLEHFEDPMPVLEESLRILKPGGLQYAVVVPVPRLRRAAVTRGVLNPPRYVANLARGLFNRRKSDSTKDGNGMIRTDYDMKDWIDFAKSIGAVEVNCIGYNPYHSVYLSSKLEEKVTLPLYEKHYQAKRKSSSAPWMQCHESVAQAHLLTFRKPLASADNKN